MKKESPIVHFIALRAAIGYLGQSEKWWNCEFLGTIGLKMLRTIFPRTYNQASLLSVIQAASLHHDRTLGQRGVNHLFRLPLDVEERINNEINSFKEQDWKDLACNNKEQAMDVLKKLSSSVIKVDAGPVQIGTIGRLVSRQSIDELAMHYHSAFIQQVQCLPYFGGKTSGR